MSIFKRLFGQGRPKPSAAQDSTARDLENGLEREAREEPSSAAERRETPTHEKQPVLLDIGEVLKQLEVLEPVAAGRLQVFGLRHRLKPHLDYLTLDEALLAKTVRITEISESGSVPTLVVDNDGDRMVFLMAGEQLIGAKQNRVLNVSMLVNARTRLKVPVSCVEAGRWGYRSRAFSSSAAGSHGKLRRLISRSSLDSLKAGRGAFSDQSAVWHEVSGKLGSLGTASLTDSLEDAYVMRRSELDGMLGRLSLPPDCCGVVFALGGRIAGLDLFDRPGTLGKLLPKLARAYALDALEEHSNQLLDRGGVADWLRSTQSGSWSRFPSPGLGHDMRVEGRRLVGAALVVDQSPVHVELFPEDNQDRVPRADSENA